VNPMATPAEVSAVLRVATKTLANWRSQGKGPAFSKAGHSVRYAWADIEAYIESTKTEASA
jgi:predicted site-specific integrase-resolvase